MANIVELREQLPDNLKDLSVFVLVGREKLTAVRAEIRAIEKLELAEEVRQQKREEARMLSEALLDAEVRIGELTKLIPKERGQRTDLQQQLSSSGVTKLNEEPVRTAANKFQKIEITQPTKAQVIEEMGFSKDQISRFETLADNKDLVEQVKAEARESNTIPTRGKVLELAKAKQRKQQLEQVPQRITDYSYKDIDKRSEIAGYLYKLIGNLATYTPDRDKVECLFQFFPMDVQEEIPKECDAAIKNLQTIKAMFTERVSKHGYEQENS